MIKRMTLLGLLSCLPIFGMAATIVGPNLKTDNNLKNEQKEIHYAELFDVPKYDSSDLGKENTPEELQKFYDYNFKNLGIKDPHSDSLIWDQTRGESITIGVIDSGIDIFHEEFLKPEAKGVQLNFDNIEQYSLIDPRSGRFYLDPITFETRKDIGLKYAYQENELTEGYYSHGTAVSATIGAAINSAGGWGVAPNVNILFISIDMAYQSIDEAIRYVSDCGAKVINMSLGGYAETWTDEYNQLHEGGESVKGELIDAIAYAHSKDVVVVASAGNDDTSKKSYPAANDGVIGVGALAAQSGSLKSDYSNFNEPNATPSSANNVDVTINGTVYAAQVAHPNKNDPNDKFVAPTLPRTADNFYDLNNGTSFSGPLTAGTIALYRSKYPEKNYKQVADALYASCDDIGLPGWDYVHGYGKLNAYNFLNSDIEVSNVAINEQDINLNLDDNHHDYPGQKLSLSFTPSNASTTYKKGIWSCDNPSVLHIDKITGDIKAIAPGTANVSFTSDAGKKVATTKVTVTGQAKVIDVTIPLVSDEMIRIKNGETGKVTATSGAPIFYAIQDENIASIDVYGNIITKTLGTTTIRATSNNQCKLITLHVHPGNDLVSISTNYGMSVFYNETWRAGYFPVDATYEDGTVKEVLALISKYPNLNTIGFTPVEYSYSEYGITKTFTSTAYVSTGGTEEYIYSKNEGENVDLSPYNYFTGNNTYITDASKHFWFIRVKGSNIDNIEYSYDDVNKASIIGNDTGINPEEIHITCDEYDLFMPGTNIYKIRLVLNDTTAQVKAKVGDTNYTVKKVEDPNLSSGYVKYEISGKAEGPIDISITNILGKTAIKTIGIDYGYDRSEDVAREYINNFLKQYSSCASQWEKRNRIYYLVNEYNYMPERCRNSKLFNESFTDNGNYDTTPIEKLKMMVSQYNSTLQEGEKQLVLVLSYDENGEPSDIYTGNNEINNFTYNHTILYITLAALGVISITSFILLISKRRRSRR